MYTAHFLAFLDNGPILTTSNIDLREEPYGW